MSENKDIGEVVEVLKTIRQVLIFIAIVLAMIYLHDVLWHLQWKDFYKIP